MEYGTRLPPRKRLLAGMKRQNCHEPWLRFHSDELRDCVREILDLRHATAEELVEASKSVALVAERAAAEARSEAAEKAESAARAKAFASSVLEAVVYGRGGCEGRSPTRGRKKRVAVDALYNKADRSGESCADDEAMARRLHRDMNSSPRRPPCKRLKGLDGAAVRGGKENVDEHHPEGRGSGTEAVPAIKKGRAKKKRILLSQFCREGSDDSKAAPRSAGHRLFSGEDGVEDHAGSSPSSLLAAKHCNAADATEETESLWKRKKLKLSQFYPESKINGSDQEAALATAS